MAIAQALNLAIAKLRAKNISLPHLEAEILLSEILKKPREFLLAHGEKSLTAGQSRGFNRLIARRLKGEPVAYLTGHKEFYGLDFMVNKNVLIPRPETELMVEEALKLLASNRQPATIIDVGTGSGCVIVSLAKAIKNYELKITCLPAYRTGRPDRQANYKLIGTDISKRALDIAKKNAKYHNVDKQIKFLESNLLKSIINNSKFVIRNSKLIIVSNLPYGWKAWKNNCSLDTAGLKFEPAIALFTDKNGLGLYEKLFQQIKELRDMSCELRDICALCEIDPRQTMMMKKLIKRLLPQAKLQIKKDLAGLNRLAIIKI
ncbi:MAG: peptide chain release factor N(5)-glutamine methyltransferase [Patescibacteria group bacterium]|nr:peptide chain release factor N(5)-glutamine methyltransferase [Patescibacteria group bacterium]